MTVESKSTDKLELLVNGFLQALREKPEHFRQVTAIELSWIQLDSVVLPTLRITKEAEKSTP